MITPIVNPNGDPVLRRGEVLIRYGGMAPLLSVCVFFIVAEIIYVATDGATAPKALYYGWIYGFFVIGHGALWLGMHYVRRSQAWDCGVHTYLWSAGFATSLAMVFTGNFPIAAACWIAPIVGSIAKRRLLRRKQQLSGGSVT